jgi:hypothetical protein
VGLTDIPTPEELDEWVERLERGYAVTGMMPRFIEGYKALYHGQAKLPLKPQPNSQMELPL